MSILYNERKKYRKKRALSKVSNFFWSVLVTITMIAGAIVLFKVATPWMKSIYSTVILHEWD